MGSLLMSPQWQCRHEYLEHTIISIVLQNRWTVEGSEVIVRPLFMFGHPDLDNCSQSSVTECVPICQGSPNLSFKSYVECLTFHLLKCANRSDTESKIVGTFP